MVLVITLGMVYNKIFIDIVHNCHNSKLNGPIHEYDDNECLY